MSDKIVEGIKSGKYDRKQLENLYSNAERLERTELIPFIKEGLKELDSRSYSKRFVKPIRDKVKSIAEEIANSEGWGNWRSNKVGNGIKAGGEMLNGELLAEFYFSYKHESWKRSSYLSVFQKNEDSTVRYTVHSHNKDMVTVDTSNEAIELFKEAIKTEQTNA
ncbi:hypothetical protein [Glaciecola sp. KUL10]|uniref:hypothetical protein n=1 Tax=Glaciecola sp. (strain KUL10) TaxID=2161813 RepID=UPI000D784CD1|nr:hypothetical protein [Glaciecola sp. KUL10]GBL04790.1 2,3-bisphosphoglycerate-independent phosphoglycerate mutase [Glaciecola sp. KUL10]